MSHTPQTSDTGGMVYVTASSGEYTASSESEVSLMESINNQYVSHISQFDELVALYQLEHRGRSLTEYWGLVEEENRELRRELYRVETNIAPVSIDLHVIALDDVSCPQIPSEATEIFDRRG